MPQYRHIKIPAQGEKITVVNGKIKVPDQPIVGYV
jgi:isocitrate dehydrogenase